MTQTKMDSSVSPELCSHGLFINDLFINGEWLKADGPKLLSTNPGTTAPVWQGHCATPEQVNQAVTA
ncbi:MAG: hypothetical protein ACPG5T_09785, partial [Endozoicomonas sp.]